MKTISIITGITLLISVNSFTQDMNPEKNDALSEQADIGGFFSFDSKLSNVNGHNVWFSGGTFGVVINRQTRIGLGGYSLDGKSMFEYPNPEENYQKYQFNTELDYFGLAFEYVFLPDAPVHITAPLLLAGGRAVIKQQVPLNQVTFPDPKEIESTYWATVERSNLAVIEPGINIELEIFSWMRLDLGTSYRFILGSHLNSLPNSDQKFSGASFHSGLKFICF